MEPVKIDISDVIDLHTFRPADVPDLLDDYISACIGKRIFSIRIIHGKGKGFLKDRVEKILAKHPFVKSFKTAPPEAGGWGATMAELKKKILVVDNEEDQRKIMRRVAERLGHAVSVATDAEEALHHIETDDFSLIILDLIMPDTDGLELCQQIKVLRPDTPVFAYSGHIGLYDAEKLERSGFDGYIPKPISVNAVREQLAQIFS